MRTVRQKVFNDFVCAADKCPDTCCKGWEIVIDDDTLEYYKNYSGDIRSTLDNCIDYDKSIIKYDDEGKCLLLREDGLCSLVREAGEESLCDTCHLYPRHVEEYEDVREWSIAVSCPIAAHLVLTDENHEYITESDNEIDPLEEDFDDFDLLLFDKLEVSRESLYRVIRNKELPIHERLSICLKMAYLMQKCIDDEEIYKIDELCNSWEKDGIENLCVKWNDDEENLWIEEYLKRNVQLLSELEHLRPEWERFLEIIDSNFDELTKTYVFINGIESKSEFIRDDYLQNLMESCIYTYYLGAVYDDMLYAKVGLSVFVTMMAEYLYVVSMHKRIQSEKTDVISCFDELEANLERIVYSLAREIEHSDDNLNTVESYFDKECV